MEERAKKEERYKKQPKKDPVLERGEE